MKLWISGEVVEHQVHFCSVALQTKFLDKKKNFVFLGRRQLTSTCVLPHTAVVCSFGTPTMKSYRRWFLYQHFKQHFFSVIETLLLPPRCKLFDICWEMRQRKLSVKATVHRWEPRPRKFVKKLTVTNPVKFQFSLSPFQIDGNRRQHCPSGSELKHLSCACVWEYACQQMSEYLIPTASLLATQRDQSFCATCQPTVLHFPAGLQKRAICVGSTCDA